MVGSSESSSGQRFSFDASDGDLKDVEWASKENSHCARATVAQGQVAKVEIFSPANDDQSCDFKGKAQKTITASQMNVRGGNSQVETARQLRRWITSNTNAIANAVACCRGRESELCPGSTGSTGPANAPGAPQRSAR